MLAPAGITEIFSLFGWGKLGWLLGIGASMLHIDVASMVRPLWETVKNSLNRGQGVTPAQIDSAVSQSIQSNTADQSPADDMHNRVAQDLREARMLRLALEQYDHQMLRLTKEPSKLLLSYAAGKAARASLIGRILGWIFKTVLMAAGLMVAGDLGAKMLGMPNALDHTWHPGQQSSSPAAIPTPVTTQTKFKPTGAGTEAAPQPWSENVTNDPGSIQNMLVQFTKDVYAGLDGHESQITSSPTFQAVKSQIAWFNQAAAGEPMVYIPQMYPNKKSIVDHYIDQVANNAA
jgi:hypothetical protein